MVGDIEVAEFLLYVNLTYQTAGRGEEMASLKFANLTLTTVKEKYSSTYNVLSLDIFRDKTSSRNSNTLFPDRNSILFDTYFSLSYFLLLSVHSSTSILPQFASKLSYDNNGRVNSTKVSSIFTAIIMKLCRLSDLFLNEPELTDTELLSNNYGLSNLNRNLRSHCGRKATMNALAESPIPYYVWVQRAGVMDRNLDKIFDYICLSKRSDTCSG